MLFVRPATSDDFGALKNLAKQAGPGFTSLAVGPDLLEKRLKKSEVSFHSPGSESAGDLYLLMVEDSRTGAVVGMSAVKAQIGIKDPFFNFRILNIAQKSAVTRRRYDMEVLVLVNEYAGATEVGSLFILPEMRGTGAGGLISQARYMLMAADPARFGDQVISELRGHVDETGFSPFWDAIGQKFFQMDFMEADRISAEQDNQFILDLMPKYPIYAALLPQDAQDMMGQTHPAGRGARRLLEAEGFRYNGVIDIFDGGPSMSVPFEDVRTIRESQSVVVAEIGDEGHPRKIRTLISNDKIDGFRCLTDKILLSGGTVSLSLDAARQLGVNTGDRVRIWTKT